MTLFQHFQYLAVPVKLTVSLVVLPVIGAELVEIQVKVLHSEIKMAKLHVMLTLWNIMPIIVSRRTCISQSVAEIKSA